MIHFKHTGINQRRTLRTEWSEVTLQDAIELTALGLPEAQDSFDWFKHTDFINGVFVKLSDMTLEELNMIQPVDKLYYFTTYLLPLVQDLHSNKPQTFVPQLIKEFEHEGTLYYMPKSLVVDEGVIVLQHGQKVKAFVEASNLLKNYADVRTEGIKAMPLFIAAVVKEQPNEDWDETQVIERSKHFKTLPMSVVWEVFFCILGLTLKSLTAILQYMNEPKAQPSRLQRWVTRLGRLRLRQAELLTRIAQLRAWRYGTF